ncbi:IucA/IucC family C-terminal-domain containing protein [Streptacidiphilus monticola]
MPGLPGLPAEAARLEAAPLMSVRTLAPADGGPHLKTSLSLRMTSAVRDISGASVRNSAALSDLLSALVAKLDGSLQITRNLAAAAALRDGVPSPDLAVLVRESPRRYAPPGTRIVPLAALAAHPPRLADPAAWLAALSRLLFPPLLQLLDWGAALEAHGQNVLVALDPADHPVLLVYRDLADIRVSPSRLARAGLAQHAVSGHVVDDRPEVLRRKLLGSLLGGALAALVAGLGGGDRHREDGLWSAVAEAAREAAVVLGDPDDRRALLADPVPVKALAAMRLEGRPPGDQWTDVPNPLADPDASRTGR